MCMRASISKYTDAFFTKRQCAYVRYQVRLQACTRIFQKNLSRDSHCTDSLVANICCALDCAEAWQTRTHTHRDNHLSWVRSSRILLSSSAMSHLRSKSCLCDGAVCSIVVS